MAAPLIMPILKAIFHARITDLNEQLATAHHLRVMGYHPFIFIEFSLPIIGVECCIEREGSPKVLRHLLIFFAISRSVEKRTAYWEVEHVQSFVLP
jgi:hypothetical protein